MHRTPVFALVLILAAFVAGCAPMSSYAPLTSTPPDHAAPWKGDSSAETITAAPDAGGPLSFRNCPTLAEARAAVPALTTGPEANGVPFKTMVLQCTYDTDQRDVQGRPAGIGILVFDASGEGIHLWDMVRTDPEFPNPTDIPGLADVAFATGAAGYEDVWVVQGDYGFHMLHTNPGVFPDDQLVALARAMLAGLARPPR